MGSNAVSVEGRIGAGEQFFQRLFQYQRGRLGGREVGSTETVSASIMFHIYY